MPIIDDPNAVSTRDLLLTLCQTLPDLFRQDADGIFEVLMDRHEGRRVYADLADESGALTSNGALHVIGLGMRLCWRNDFRYYAGLVPHFMAHDTRPVLQLSLTHPVELGVAFSYDTISPDDTSDAVVQMAEGWIHLLANLVQAQSPVNKRRLSNKEPFWHQVHTDGLFEKHSKVTEADTEATHD